MILLFGTRFFESKNHAYKNIKAKICLKFKNIVVILRVAISISFPAKFRRSYKKKSIAAIINHTNQCPLKTFCGYK